MNVLQLYNQRILTDLSRVMDHFRIDYLPYPRSNQGVGPSGTQQGNTGDDNDDNEDEEDEYASDDVDDDGDKRV